MTTETITVTSPDTPDQIDVWVRTVEGDIKVSLSLKQYPDDQRRGEIGRAAAEGGMRLHLDACGFWIGNWDDRETRYGSVLEAARAYTKEDGESAARTGLMDEDDARNLSLWLRLARVYLDATQADLAERLGFARITIARIERGDPVEYRTAYVIVTRLKSLGFTFVEPGPGEMLHLRYSPVDE